MDRRKISSQSATVAGNNWSREKHPDAIRYASSNTYEQDCSSGQDAKYPEGRTSEESVVDVQTANVNKNNTQNYPDESVYVNVVPRHVDNTALREKYQRANDSPRLTMPDAVMAMQRLQKLKELQIKRDLSERYYAQEIKRLIAGHYFGPRTMTAPTLKPNGKVQSSSFQPYTRERVQDVTKNLEPCGTMTTVTRLDCGCIQETTRPIFTTARGRVQRKNCSQSQDEILLKLASSNPHEHLLSSLEQRNDKPRMKPKKRISLDPRICANLPPAGDQNNETDKRNDSQDSETPGRVSRNGSPHRKYSDTSATSI